MIINQPLELYQLSQLGSLIQKRNLNYFNFLYAYP